MEKIILYIMYIVNIFWNVLLLRFCLICRNRDICQSHSAICGKSIKIQCFRSGICSLSVFFFFLSDNLPLVQHFFFLFDDFALFCFLSDYFVFSTTLFVFVKCFRSVMLSNTFDFCLLLFLRFAVCPIMFLYDRFQMCIFWRFRLNIETLQKWVVHGVSVLLLVGSICSEFISLVSKNALIDRTLRLKMSTRKSGDRYSEHYKYIFIFHEKIKNRLIWKQKALEHGDAKFSA